MIRKPSVLQPVIKVSAIKGNKASNRGSGVCRQVIDMFVIRLERLGTVQFPIYRLVIDGDGTMKRSCSEVQIPMTHGKFSEERIDELIERIEALEKAVHEKGTD